MTRHPTTAPRRKARIAGALYLIVIAAGFFAEVLVRQRMIAAGDAAATARNILAHPLLYRGGFAAELFALACNLPIAVIFYDLFKPVRRTFALLVVFFTLVGSAVEAASLLLHFAPLLLLGGSPGLSGLGSGPAQALAYLSLRLQTIGFSVALVFFGFYCFSLGWLILRSSFLPRILGVFLAIEGACYLVNSFAQFLAPGFAANFLPILMASGLAEVALCLWLLVFGLNAERWQAQAALAG